VDAESDFGGLDAVSVRTAAELDAVPASPGDDVTAFDGEVKPRRHTFVRVRTILVALAALALAGCGSDAPIAARHSRATSGPASTASPTKAAEPNKTASGRPPSCAAWSGPSSATTRALTSAHGEIRDCFRDGNTWFVFELGNRTEPGGIDEFTCRTVGCAPSATWFQPSRWKHIASPYGEGMTLLRIQHDGTMIVDSAGHEVLFHPASGDLHARLEVNESST
jgi:hypothetical protein